MFTQGGIFWFLALSNKIKQQKPENSALCEHVILFDHVIDWANSRILKTESNFSKR